MLCDCRRLNVAHVIAALLENFPPFRLSSFNHSSPFILPEESEREGFVFVERLKEGNSTSDVTSSNAPNADSSPATTSAASPTKQSATSASTSSNVDADAALAARLGDLDVRRGQVETESIQKTSPSHSIGAAAATSGVTNSGGGEADNFLTLKYVKGGFCLDKKLEKKVKNRQSNSSSAYDDEPWLRPKLDLDEFEYDFTLERSVLRDYS